MPITGIGWFGSDAALQAFVDRHGLSFPQVSDGEGQVFRRFGIQGQPAWVFITADGTVSRRLGALGAEGLEAALAATADGQAP